MHCNFLQCYVQHTNDGFFVDYYIFIIFWYGERLFKPWRLFAAFTDFFDVLQSSMFSVFVILSKLSRTLLTQFKNRCQSLPRDLFPFGLLINTLCIILPLACLLQTFRFQQTLDSILSFTISLYLLHFYITNSRVLRVHAYSSGLFFQAPCVWVRHYYFIFLVFFL